MEDRMKTFFFLKVFLVACAAILISACSFSFADFGKSNSERVLIKLNFQTTPLVSASGRAIVGGDGYLYVRTFGGPTGSEGPVYGPYRPSGGKISLTGIPSGTFSDILVVYSSVDEGTELVDLLKGPEGSLYDSIKPGAALNPLNAILDGFASASFTGSKELVPGTNSITLTLIPVCGDESTLVPAMMGTSIYEADFLVPVPAPITKRFLRLDLSALPAGWSGTDLTVASDVPSVSLALYDDQGERITDFSYDSGTSLFSLLSASNYTSLFLYFEAAAEGSILVSLCDPSVTPSPSPTPTPSPTSTATTSPTPTPSSSPVLSSEKDILTFYFPIEDAYGTIDHVNGLISVVVPYGTNTASLTPSLSISGMSVTPASGIAQDFTSAIAYEVTAQDNSKKTYTVTVAQDAPPVMVVTGPTSFGGTAGLLSSGSTVNFGMLFSVDTPNTIAFTVENTGTGVLVLSSASISGNDPSFYPMTAPSTPVLPGTSVTFTIDFIMPTSGTYVTRLGTLLITTNDPGTPSFVLNLTGYCS
jgi:hypothetical protein